MNWLKRFYSKQSVEYLEDILLHSNDLQVQQLVFAELLHREINK